jgi:hypothetical protein
VNGSTFSQEETSVIAAKRAGLIVGVVIIVQMICGVVVNFVLEAPLFAAPGFLANAASHARQIGLAALMGLAAAALPVGIAITVWPIFVRRSRTLALWFAALAVVGLAVAAVESANVMSLVSLSEAYTKATAGEREQLQTLRSVVASARNWVHYMGRILDGVTLFVFYAVLYRLALVPRALAGFGLVAVTLMIAGVVMPFFGRGVAFPMLAPLGLSQLILAIWLTTRGFRDQPDPPHPPVGGSGARSSGTRA